MPLDAEDVRAHLAGRFADIYTRYTQLKPVAGRLRGPCPLHGGQSPSFAVNPEDGGWHCFSACQSGGDLFKFLMLAEHLTFPEAVERAGAFAGLSSAFGAADAPPRPPIRRPAAVKPAPAPPQPLDLCLAEDLHERLMRCRPMVEWLQKERGLTTKTLTRFHLGLHRDDRDYGFYRVCFPVYDRQGRLMNIRRHLFSYRPELTAARRRDLGKTKSWRAEGNWLSLYPLHVLEGAREVLIVEGEADALLSNQLGFAAVTGTGGAGTWKEEWTEELRGLARATILYDGDAEGEKGAGRVASSVSAVVADVWIARYADV